MDCQQKRKKQIKTKKTGENYRDHVQVAELLCGPRRYICEPLRLKCFDLSVEIQIKQMPPAGGRRRFGSHHRWLMIQGSCPAERCGRNPWRLKAIRLRLPQLHPLPPAHQVQCLPLHLQHLASGVRQSLPAWHGDDADDVGVSVLLLHRPRPARDRDRSCTCFPPPLPPPRAPGLRVALPRSLRPGNA